MVSILGLNRVLDISEAHLEFERVLYPTGSSRLDNGAFMQQQVEASLFHRVGLALLSHYS